ncbi:helix-turn-helix transcriptional regulator [Streptomyces chrestomyceticus]|uniref:helix-turn-helix transcriptional regulator n=1 Tax=Streptomyces chrestomyceticus TaxID=68185 RepID=UPI0019D2DF94|nr:helix-turn-helix transcriptional regulator [Streptomyces chrestomyceticus]
MVRGNPTPKGLRQRLYELALQQGSWTTRQAAALLGAAEEEIEEAADSLENVGLLRPAPRKSSGYAVVAPEVALSRLFTQEGHQIARHQEQLAHTREAMISIARDYLGVRSSPGRTLAIEALPTAEHEESFLDRAADVARQEVWLMHGGPTPSAEFLDEMLLRCLGMLSSGVAVRALFLHQQAGDRLVSGHVEELAHAGAQVRVASHLPQRMLIIDWDLALVPVDPENSTQGFWAVHGTELVPALRAAYDHCWMAASAAGAHVAEGASSQRLSAVEEAVIRMLAEGMKDETIARRVGVSPRTLSRLISTLLDRLGVQTRFQAALELSRRGWLGDDDLAQEGAA